MRERKHLEGAKGKGRQRRRERDKAGEGGTAREGRGKSKEKYERQQWSKKRRGEQRGGSGGHADLPGAWPCQVLAQCEEDLGHLGVALWQEDEEWEEALFLHSEFALRG